MEEFEKLERIDLSKIEIEGRDFGELLAQERTKFIILNNKKEITNI